MKRTTSGKGKKDAIPRTAPPFEWLRPAILLSTGLQAVFIALVAFLCFANTLGHDWAYDDNFFIIQNRFITEPGHIREIFTTTYHYGTREAHTNLYRPLTNLSFLLNRMISGLEPASYHLINVLLHTANSVLAFLIFLPWGKKAAVITGLLFASHPVHTEAVANVFSRSELQSFFFLALAWLLFRKRESALCYVAAIFAFFLSIMTKETGLLLLPIIFLSIAGESIRKRKLPSSAELLGAAGFLVPAAVFLLLRGMAIINGGELDPVGFHQNPLFPLSFFERLPSGLGILTRYIHLLIFPLNLSADYSYNQIPLISFGHPLSMAGAMLIMGAFAGLAASVKSAGIYTALLFLVLPFGLFSNILFPIGTIMGERLLYLPSLGFCALGAFFITAIFSNKKSLVLAVSMIMVLYSARTITRNEVWKNNDTLYLAMAKDAPNSAKGAFNHAIILHKQGKLPEAEAEFKRATDTWQGYKQAWISLGLMMFKQGRYRESLEAYDNSGQLDTNGMVIEYAARCHLELGETGMAVELYDRLIELSEDEYPGKATRLGIMLAELGHYEISERYFLRELEKNSHNVDTLLNLANLYSLSGNDSEADSHYRKALEISPEDDSVNNLLLIHLLETGKKQQAELQHKVMAEKKMPFWRETHQLLRDAGLR